MEEEVARKPGGMEECDMSIFHCLTYYSHDIRNIRV